MFRILNEPTQNCLVYGGYGTGKTIGIIMFNQLALFKSKFMIEAKKDPIKNEELRELTK
jgi:hypothetical protein